MIPTRFASARALAKHPELASLIIEFFHARHDPEGPAADGLERAEQEIARIRAAIQSKLDTVTTLADDRAIRRVVSLVDATTRTNYFRGGGAEPDKRSGGVPYISIKIRGAVVEELRRTGLLYEVFVTRRRWRASTSAGLQSRAAGSAGPTDPTTSAPRCWAGADADGEERRHRTGGLEGRFHHQAIPSRIGTR
jgi:hypothetical protein